MAERAERFFDAVEQLGRLHQHPLAPTEDHGQLIRRDAPPGQLDRGLEHRERERLDPIAVEAEVLHLSRGKECVDVRVPDVSLEQLAKLTLGDVEPRLAVPERVVAVEPHHPDGHRDEGLSGLPDRDRC